MRLYKYSEEELRDYIAQCARNSSLELDQNELVTLLMNGDNKTEIISPEKYHGLLGTKFISISDIGVDLIAFILCNGPADYVSYCLSNQNIVAPSVGLAAGVATFIYCELQKVVQLRGEEYCIYKQAVTHYRRHEDFSISDMTDWLPMLDATCNMHHNKLYCRYRNTQDCCSVKKNSEKLIDIMDSMVDKKCLKPGKELGSYRLAY